MSPVCLDAVDEVMNHTVADFIAQLEVAHEDVAHRLSFQQLGKEQQEPSLSLKRWVV